MVAREMLVLLGGGDLQNATQTVLERLAEVPVPLRITVIVGVANPHRERLQAALPTLRGRHAVELHVNPPNLRELMERSDLAITAAGSTVWELANRGVPMLLAVVADNQRLIAADMAATGLCGTVGLQSSTATEDVATISALVLGAPERKRMSAALRQLVDGRGSLRVAAALSAHPLRLRCARSSDAELLWRWANDPDARCASFSSAQIPWAEHLRWFESKLATPDSVVWIATDMDGNPVGQLRFDAQDQAEAVVSVSLAPERRGGGLAVKLIRLGAFQLFEEARWQKVFAFIKADNVASRRSFERAGFVRNGPVVLINGHPAEVWQFLRK